MTDRVTYYRVDLKNGITVEEKPSGYYRESPDYGRTIFKNMRRAKGEFAKLSKLEIQRIRSLQRSVRPLSTREALKERAFEPYRPENFG